MTPQDFAYLANFIRERSGIVLPAEKAYLLENRLKPLASWSAPLPPDRLRAVN